MVTSDGTSQAKQIRACWWQMFDFRIGWNLYNETGEVLSKHTFHHLPAIGLTKSCLFSLSWKAICLERPQDLVVALYRFYFIFNRHMLRLGILLVVQRPSTDNLEWGTSKTRHHSRQRHVYWLNDNTVTVLHKECEKVICENIDVYNAGACLLLFQTLVYSFVPGPRWWQSSRRIFRTTFWVNNLHRMILMPNGECMRR